jgi:hypothetical protein
MCLEDDVVDPASLPALAVDDGDMPLVGPNRAQPLPQRVPEQPADVAAGHAPLERVALEAELMQEGSASEGTDSSSSASSSSSSESVDRVDRPRVGLAPRADMDVDAWLNSLGIRWQEEDYVPLDGRAPYKRIGMSCPLRHSHHFHDRSACHKWRGLGHRQTGRYGRLESVGLLLTWIERAHTFPSRVEHMGYHPTDVEVDACLARHGLLERGAT